MCDKCGENEATVHLCEIRRGIPSELHMCTRCAEMFLPIERSDVADLLEQLPPRGVEVPRDAIYLENEPGPDSGELEMTAVGQHIATSRYAKSQGLMLESEDFISKPVKADLLLKRLGDLL